MRVIGAALPRTGTMSTRAALDLLGFGPCYHFVTQLERPHDAQVWRAAAEGREVDWKAFLADFGCGLDWPLSAFYRTLMEVWPDARVLLNVRDGASWYRSMRETVYPASQGALTMARDDVLRRCADAIDALGWQGTFRGRFEDAAFAIQTYDAWNAAVRAAVPAERLLEFDVRDGWDPLCRFLGVASPQTPFPRLNDAATFKQRFL